MPYDPKQSYSVAGIGLILIGTGFLLAGIASLFPSASVSLLGIVLDILGIALFFLEWSHLTSEERRLSAYGAILFIVAAVVSFFTGAFILTLNFTAHSVFHSSSSPLNASFQAVGGAFYGLFLYLAFFLFPYAFADREEKSILTVGLVGGLIASVVLNPIVVGGNFYHITNLGPLEDILVDVVSLIFGVAYVVIGNRVRLRR